MGLSRRFATNRNSAQVVGKIEGYTPAKRRTPHLSAEEVAWVTEKIAAGLTNIEIVRMFFRTFGRGITENTAKYWRRKLNE